jgi:poly-gamma-glutamate synthesis protein (capsule biosynthesis protein)
MNSSDKLLIGVGDLMAHHADMSLLDHVAPMFRDADVVFGNCEWPYSEVAGDTHPVEAHLNDLVDEGDLFLPGDPASVGLFGRSGFNVMSFANNHCLHAGYRAFLRTMELLRSAGIDPVGAGVNIQEALRPVILERGGVKVAFVGCASAMLPGTHAGRRVPGIAPLRRHSYFHNPEWEIWGINPKIGTLVNRDDLAAVCASIRQARENADVVVVSCHWGLLEERAAIGDYQRDAAHAFIDNGADLIFGHGPMVIKGIEVYKGKVIFYSLGKFLMKGPVPTGKVPLGISVALGDEARKGMAAMVTISGGKIARVGFALSFTDDHGRPQFIKSDHQHFSAIVEDVRTVSQAAGLPVTLSVDGDQVTVS